MGLAALALMEIIILSRKGETMSNHWDAPGMKPPNMDVRIDICDIYAFQKPKDVNKSVLVLNVNPVAPTYADAILKWGSGIGF
jgi:hypothetical protein